MTKYFISSFLCCFILATSIASEPHEDKEVSCLKKYALIPQSKFSLLGNTKELSKIFFIFKKLFPKKKVPRKTLSLREKSRLSHFLQNFNLKKFFWAEPSFFYFKLQESYMRTLSFSLGLYDRIPSISGHIRPPLGPRGEDFSWDNFTWCSDEILIHIFAFLSIEDLVIASQVNKRFYSTVQDNFYRKAREIISTSFQNHIEEKPQALVGADVFIQAYLPNILKMQKIIQEYSTFFWRGGKHEQFFNELPTLLSPAYFKAIEEGYRGMDLPKDSYFLLERVDTFFNPSARSRMCILF